MAVKEQFKGECAKLFACFRGEFFYLLYRMEDVRTKMPRETCQAKDPVTGYFVCDRPILVGTPHQRCIFHLPEKTKGEFEQCFLEELRYVNDTETINEFNCRFFLFPENLTLKALTFEKNVTFENAKFEDGVIFDRTTFKGIAHFRGAQFANAVSFSESQFEDKGVFSQAKFGDLVSFSGAQFRNEVSFFSTEFGDRADFLAAQFKSKSDFRYAQFGNEVSFYAAEFKGGSDFRGARFQGDLDFSSVISPEIIDFRNVLLFRPNKVRMHRLLLNSILLVGTNVQEIYFLECKWPVIEERCWPIYESRQAVQDEIQRKAGNKKAASLEEIEQLYRRLQINFENSKRYGEAGDFYIGVMEMRRQQLSQRSDKVWRGLRQNIFSLIAWYRHVSLYGERYARCLLWILATFLLFPAFYLLAGFEYPATDPPGEKYVLVQYVVSHKIVPSFLSDYLKALNISFHAFTFQREGPFHLSICSRIVSIIESVVSATLLALFLLAVRRRFRR